MTVDRTGLMMLRMWIEADPRSGFRARITHTLDASVPDQAMVTVATPEDLYVTVRDWVEAFVNPN